MIAFIPGFLAGLSLIIAIGAQNAFVIKQGLTKQHVFLTVSICAVSDALLHNAEDNSSYSGRDMT